MYSDQSQGWIIKTTFFFNITEANKHYYTVYVDCILKVVQWLFCRLTKVQAPVSLTVLFSDRCKLILVILMSILDKNALLHEIVNPDQCALLKFKLR